MDELGMATYNFRQSRTYSGYDFTIIKSALQKYIRRGNMDMALYMIREIIPLGLIDNKTAYTNILHRLQVIFLEDIGIGNLHYLPKIHEWMEQIYSSYKSDKRDLHVEICNLERITRMMCLSKKTRLCSYLRAYSFSESFHPFLESLEGKPLQEIFKIWNDTILNKKIESVVILIHLVQKLKKKEIKYYDLNTFFFNLSLPYIAIMKRWFQHIGKLDRDGFLVYMTSLSANLFEIEPIQCWDDSILCQFSGNFPEWKYIKTFDDFVYDCHVGKSVSRDPMFFATYTSLVYPKMKIPEEYEKHYLWLKNEKKGKPEDMKLIELNEITGIIPEIIPETIKNESSNSESSKDSSEDSGTLSNEESENDCDSSVQDELSSVQEESESSSEEEEDNKESELGTFMFRIQLTTGNGKQDTYMIKGEDDKYYIVKGPYIEKEVVERILYHQKKKEKYGVPMMNCRMEMCVPDRWPEGVPLGIRNKINRKECYAFLVSELLVDINTYVLRKHSSKVWPETEVIEPEKSCCHISNDLSGYTKQEKIDYLNAIGFRYKYGLSDMATRNFIRSKGHIYSIDEDAINHHLSLYNELNKTRFTQLKELYKEYQEYMNVDLKNELVKGIESECKKK